MSGVETGRRRFLQASLGALLATPAASIAAKPARGRTVVDVRSKGARGDGRHDDTTAFQKAVDSLPPEGGIVTVPAGRYVIDPLRNVRLRSRMHLRMAQGARLMARPNAADRAYVLLVQSASDVEISGGGIVGDRDRHLGRTGEWGHGIMVRGSSRVTIRDIRISRCWGDGMSIGGLPRRGAPNIPSTDVRVERVVCTGNRRQGLTIGGTRRVVVVDCEFNDTHGTKPEYGIDIEPDYPSIAQDVRIERCVVRGNRGGGIQVYKRVSKVTIRNCTIEGNGYGVYVIEASDGVIEDNRISGNRHAGVALQKQARDYRVGRNTFKRNGAWSMPSLGGNPAKGHIRIASDARGIVVSGNRYD